MSFGFSVSDFLTVITLITKVRKDFVGAPAQFQQISNELRYLEHTTRDIEVLLSGKDLSQPQEERLHELTKNCNHILEDVQGTVRKYSTLESKRSGIREKASRLWNRLQWEPDDVRNLRGRITLSVASCTVFLGMLNGENVAKLVEGQKQQGQREQKRDHQEILDWLTPANYHDQQSDFIRRRQPGTGQWLLDSPEYQNWVATKGELLFCPGIPGAGKTMLTSIAIENLLTLYSADESVGICYAFLNFQRTSEQKLNNLIALLVKQLAQTRQTLPGSVGSLFSRHKRRQTRPSFDELCEALNSMINDYSRVFVVIDALDECQVEDDCRSKFISVLLNIWSKLRVNVLATSRFIPEITSRFGGAVVKEIRASDEDIITYVDGKLSSLPNFVSRNADLQDEIKKSIVGCIDGMFLLAQLHLDSLRGKRSARAIRNALSELPKGSEAYDAAYTDAINRIKGQLPDQRDLALEALLWITYAKRPLTTIELRHALGVELNETEFYEDNLSDLDDIVSNCCGLVTVDEESDIIRLVHYTTQEYFSRTGTSWFPGADLRIAQICVTYLSFDTFKSGACPRLSEFKKRLYSYPFYSYASKYWGTHAYSAPNHQFCYKFLTMSASVNACSQAFFMDMSWKSYGEFGDSSPYMTRQMNGLHLAALWGLSEAAKSLVEVSEINAPDYTGATPIIYAIRSGNAPIVELLLQKGVGINSMIQGKTLLGHAALNGRLSVAKLLLEKGADITSKTTNIHTPLHYAVSSGDKAMAEFLIEKGADIDSKGKDGVTPLSIAVSGGIDDMVQFLLEQGANIESEDIYGVTPLVEALIQSNEAIVQALLDNGADVTFKGKTPLFYALTFQNDAVAQLLRKHGVVVE
ncbi:hypothetical protein F5Y12DRAFT_687267 [Xylaria sp. FL1777]|nr:hypothetical protein F5Y12DRAFT_687267 [Xylaria sp. FL1777]